MKLFDYVRATSTGDAVSAGGDYIAGGTDLLNLMKDGVEAPDRVVDINALPLGGISLDAGVLRIGALARMAEVAAHPAVRHRLPVISQALLDSASPQIRNMASISGNLLQRTRCWYFRDTAFACHKRRPGSGCPAQDGQNRWHAILGGSDRCIAVHASDLAVALTALEATVVTHRRRIPISEFYLLPEGTPERENVLESGELITGIEVPVTTLASRSRYLKLRDRATFEFAVVSVAAAVRLRGGEVDDVRLAFGGVAPRPWRSPEAEAALKGGPLTDERIRAAGQALVRDARPREHNAFKVELVQRALAQILGGFR
ncbi:xanthine dehydrogenase YagS FAD-binding subunit [Thermocatellispora tengchongensis]|uniref:Xanthine dehydrogenase YagS FAD-binding subunit n=1 Tax=Thermocatellispora tengchongensis TaxID=1073253 RepID=A0A840PE98_9ACTN|nr:xanthine dehydrogenase family protein subunit M [Thermocatellispora tengchongensis]MBB5137309.1 xanthine dehydrogenase YagS FAD-binding subunit [Thermocatellispora tengchongensis]